MSRVDQLFLGLDEAASERLEALLAQETCPAHTATTLDGGVCEMCDLDETQHAAASEAIYAVQSVMAPSQWPDESTPEWVRRAKANRLPTKIYQS